LLVIALSDNAVLVLASATEVKRCHAAYQRTSRVIVALRSRKDSDVPLEYAGYVWLARG
jgi:hypothetical protein